MGRWGGVGWGGGGMGRWRGGEVGRWTGEDRERENLVRVKLGKEMGGWPGEGGQGRGRCEGIGQPVVYGFIPRL